MYLGSGGSSFGCRGKLFENGYWIKQEIIINFYREKYIFILFWLLLVFEFPCFFVNLLGYNYHELNCFYLGNNHLKLNNNCRLLFFPALILHFPYSLGQASKTVSFIHVDASECLRESPSTGVQCRIAVRAVKTHPLRAASVCVSYPSTLLAIGNRRPLEGQNFRDWARALRVCIWWSLIALTCFI